MAQVSIPYLIIILMGETKFHVSFQFGPHDTFQVFQLYPISWLISNNEYGIIVNLGLKYGKTASAFYLHGTLWLV